jgi:multicomponent Na+:H+ antiporter subunit E
MTAFLWNIGLAAVWALAVGELTLANLAIGFALGYGVLWLVRGLLDTGSYCARILWLIEFVLYFLWELLKANLRVAFDIVTPKHYMRPGILALPLDAETDMEITILANTISLTPGTLSLEVSADRKTLYIHHMYLSDLEQQKRGLKQGFERRLLRVLR